MRSRYGLIKKIVILLYLVIKKDNIYNIYASYRNPSDIGCTIVSLLLPRANHRIMINSLS